MSATRFLTARGYSPRVIALLVGVAVIASGIGFPHVSPAGGTVAADDERSDSQPCEEPQDESVEDEEASSGKHAAVIGAAVVLDSPLFRCPGSIEPSALFPGGLLSAAQPIRGPPQAV